SFKNSEDPIIFPFLKLNSNYSNFILFPKEITNVYVKSAEPDKKKVRISPLKYDDWNDYGLICSLSEPFLTPVIEHILSAIAGYGTPDYPVVVKKMIEENVKCVNKN
ncbi:MAG: hypothetical protein KGJ59_12765, partial [Bacteroidota bacterium]|nr:hypothetical protein [Bacteroidota bacterium]